MIDLPCPLCPKPNKATHRVVWEGGISRVYCFNHAIEVHTEIAKAPTEMEPIEG